MKYTATMVRMLFFFLFLYLLVNEKTMLWLGLFGFTLIIAMIFGRVYCGYVCPMNTLMGFVDRISNKLKIQTETIPKWLARGYFTWIALSASIAGIVISKKFLNTNFPILIIWLVISLLVTLRYKPAVFHNLICPFGIFQKIFGKYVRIATKVDNKKCIGCKLCEKACPSNAIAVVSEKRKAEIIASLCFQCANCCQVCPKEAISYRK